MTLVEVLVGLVILVGLLGIVLPILPGTVLVLGAILVWAIDVGSGTAWAVFAIAATLLVVGAVVKYLIPHRGLRASGVPSRSLLTGAALGLVGFFVIPVLGLFVGFIGGVYLAERQRLGGGDAWPSTRAAVKAVGLSVLVELIAGLLATVTWVVGVALT